jgi:hypothetical protein
MRERGIGADNLDQVLIEQVDVGAEPSDTAARAADHAAQAANANPRSPAIDRLSLGAAAPRPAGKLGRAEAP